MAGPAGAPRPRSFRTRFILTGRHYKTIALIRRTPRPRQPPSYLVGSRHGRSRTPIGVGPMRCQPVRLLPTLYGEVRGILSTRYPCSPSRGARWEVSRACPQPFGHMFQAASSIYNKGKLTISTSTLPRCSRHTHTWDYTLHIVCPAPRGGRRNGAGRDNRRRTAKPCSAGSFGASE